MRSTRKRTFGFLGQVLCFAVTFCLEVRVHAASVERHAASLPMAVEVQQVPNECLEGKDLCAVKTFPSEKYLLKFEGAEVVLDSAASVIRLASDKIEFVTGVIWIKAEKDFTVRTEYGEIHLGPDSQAWLSRREDAVNIANVEGAVDAQPRGGKQKMAIETGFENSLMKVDQSGRAQTSSPIAIDFKSHVERWARLYHGKKADFEKEVAEFHETWKAARDEAAKIHEELYSRKIASIKSEESRKAEKAKAAEVKNRVMREKARRHYYESLGLAPQ